VSKENINIEQILDRMRRLDQLIEDRQLDDALELALKIEAAVTRAGIRSAHVTWTIGVIYDYRQEPELAFARLQDALSMDPFALPFRHSVQLISNRIRAALRAPERPAGDPSTLRLWELLARAGQADDGAHVALGRFHLATGNDLEALRILVAVTALFPACKDAWALQAVVAAKLGDHQLAERAAAEAALLGAEPIPFSIPGGARS